MQLKILGRKLHRTYATFGYGSMTPTMWACANVIPVHSQATFDDYGMGLGCNTMEGREQKHQIIAKYQRQTTPKERWRQTFRHEFIHMGYLRLNGFDRTKYTKKSKNYIPVSSDGCCKRCQYTMPSGSCLLCDHVEMSALRRALVEGKLPLNPEEN